LFERLVQALREGLAAALCTIIEKVGFTPRGIGSKMLVLEDGRCYGSIGGGKLERMVVEEALKAIKENRSKVVRLSLRGEYDLREGYLKTGMMCGGDISVFIDVIGVPRLIIIGAGKVGHAIARLADLLGFQIKVIDVSSETANRERFPMAEEIVVDENLSKALGKVELSSRDYVLILTGDPELDYEALKALCKREFRYLGLLGSPAKRDHLLERLEREEGVKLRDKWYFHSPIGLRINAVTPEEIAVSIMAEIIKEMRSHGSR